MLFTPSSHSTRPVSASVNNEPTSPQPLPSSSSSSTASSLTPSTTGGTRHNEGQSSTTASPSTTTVVTNGPQNNRSTSTEQSRISEMPDQDWFYSPKPQPPTQPTSTNKLPDTKSSGVGRRVSCPVAADKNKRGSRFHFPTIITSSIRDALTTNSSTTNSNIYANDALYTSRLTSTGCSRPTSIFLSVANPVAAAALVEDDESAVADEQQIKSFGSSPLDSPKQSTNSHPTSLEGSRSLAPSHSQNSKAILNVGGVRHEGMSFLFYRFGFVYLIF